MLGTQEVFSPPVPCHPPLHCFDPGYISRKSHLTERTVVLRSGRVIAYLEEGAPHERPVLAFHGGCATKVNWILKERLPGVRLIAVDRMGYGASSSVSWDSNYSFEDALADMKEFVDALGLDKFIVIGVSNGTAFALQAAAAWPDRVCGCCIFSGYTDPCHATATPDISKTNGAGMASIFRDGCCAGCFRGLLRMVLGPSNDKKASDIFKGLAKKEGKAAPTQFADFAADPFNVSWILGVSLSYDAKGFDGLMWDMRYTRATKWPFDIASIMCPTFVWSGKRDWAAPYILSEHNAKVIPGARLNASEEDAHVTLYMQYHRAIASAVEACFSGR